MLASRQGWAERRVKVVQRGRLEAISVPVAARRSIRGRVGKGTVEQVDRLWPDAQAATPTALRAELDRVANLIRSQPGDPRSGAVIFTQRCRACHALFGTGGRVGPDLTPFRRDDRDPLLLSVVNPSAEIREGYASIQVATRDGRSVAGILIEQDARILVLRTAEGRDVTIHRDEVEEIAPTGTSHLPENLLRDLGEPAIRDLFAYLRGNQPPKEPGAGKRVAFTSNRRATVEPPASRVYDDRIRWINEATAFAIPSLPPTLNPTWLNSC